MKIRKVTADNRHRRFEVTTSRGILAFPFARCDPEPSPRDRLDEVYVDPDFAREAFTYRLASGAEGSVHIDSVLDVNADPDYLAKLALYELSVRANEQLKASGLSVRDAAERLNTSPAQLYRLLDPTNYAKSAHQLLALLALGGASVTVVTEPRRTAAKTKAMPKKPKPRKAVARRVPHRKAPKVLA